MKICAACNEELPREGFSKKQWQTRQYKRRCKGCIDAGRVVQLQAHPTLEEPTPLALPTAAAEDDVVSCYFCFEEGADELGQPLRRDCSCRGGSGWAHLPCIVEYARDKNKNWKGDDGMNEFSKPWRECLGCKQLYQNEIAVELATELVSFVKKQYPDDHSMFLEALDVKLRALAGQRAHREEAKQIANKILSTIESMKVADPSLPQSLREIEVTAFNVLGWIFYHEGKEGARVAIEYFEKSRGIRKELGLDTTWTESHIALANLKCDGDSHKNKEEAIKTCQKVYTQRVAEYGEMHCETVGAGLRLAIALCEGNRLMEAEKLLAKLLVTCKLLHGLDHKYTKIVEAELRECSRANQTQSQL